MRILYKKRMGRAFIYLFSYLLWNMFFHSVSGMTGEHIVTRITDEAGLPQNSIKGIAPDNLGFIWILTESGAVRYDGKRFKATESLNSTLQSKRMFSFHAGTKESGILWAQTSTEQMVCLRNGKAIAQGWTARDFLKKTFIGGKATFSRGLPTRYKELDTREVILGEVGGNSFLLKKDTLSYYPANSSLALVSIPYPSYRIENTFYHDKKLYHLKDVRKADLIESDGDISECSIKGDLMDEAPDADFKLFYNSGTKETFIYCRRSLYLLEPVNGELSSTRILYDFSFEENGIVIAHYQKDNDQLFLGSASKGLFIIQNKRFSTKQTSNGADNEVYYLQTILPDGSILADEGNVFHLDGEHSKLDLLSRIKEHGRLIGPNGQLWVLTEDSLLMLTSNGKKLLSSRANPEKGRVIYQDATGNIWFGSLDGTLYQWDLKSSRFVAKGELEHEITWIEQANDDNLWLGSSDGLFLVERNGTVIRHEGLAGRYIRCLYKDQDKRLWICTFQHGLFLLSKQKFTHFPLDKHHYIATAHCILEDKKGYLWISTNKGLFQADKEQLLAYAENSANIPDYFYYDKRAGFATNEFNGGCQPCALQLPNGLFSFPSLDGLIWFDPETIQPRYPQGPVIIDEISLDGAPIPITERVSLPRYFSRLDITLSTPFFGSQEDVKLEYIIDKEHEETAQWLSFSTDENSISINNLPFGEHLIQVRLKSGESSHEFIYTSLKLYVEPAFHETWLFKAMLFLVGLGIIWFGFFMKSKFVMKQNQTLKQLVSERSYELRKQSELQKRLSASITHDVKAPLNYVVLTLQGIYKQLKLEKNHLSDDVENIYDVTKQITQYCNKISQFYKATFTDKEIELHEANLHHIVDEQIKVFKHLASQRNTTIINSVPCDLNIRTHADILAIILHNLLDNATKHTRNGIIAIHAGVSKQGKLYITIKDDGVGISPRELQHFNEKDTLEPGADPFSQGLGITLVKDWIRMLGGKVYIHSTLGKGTIVTLTFSAQAMHLKSVQ
ncbi:two-component regulator propeller domain-containing protein [Olivibacter sp. 47]|uniref:ligand-binding sensor domain-containing protein n=1 Tax=Olivibacter sp. 47 TaxID=3056486 RepID=UPI0025A39D4B|nr:sensor histidine kinase [Olivibacter sp. 47]MDM8176443.1 two-component regulator propeller domain-containing protein [Olivibacter sp. 47]